MRRRDALICLAGLKPRAGLSLPYPDRPLALTDSYGDGLPDFLRLRERADQETFRRWTVWLAEALYFSQPALPPDVVDCAALLRFCYREALRRHDAAWMREMGLPELPPLGDIRQYNFPVPRLRDRIFRVRSGAFRESDLADGAFRAFADAEHLMRRNAHMLGRQISGALPGDLLFYHQLTERMPYHSMVWTGGAAIYHTGPAGASKGEIRRLDQAELMNHPEPRWRPQPGNPNFLGVYRWNLLRDPS